MKPDRTAATIVGALAEKANVQIIVRPHDDGSVPRFIAYQQAWIKDPSQFKLIEKSRQTGLSFSTQYALSRRKCVNTARTDAWVSSSDEAMAQIFAQGCKRWAEVLNLGASDLGERVLLDANGKEQRVFEVRFANGMTIHSMSSSVNAQAGKVGDRVLDEFALHRDPRMLLGIAMPGTTWGGKVEIISTHRGTQNLFNQLVQEARYGGNPKGISLHRVTLQDALDQGLLRAIQAKLRLSEPEHPVLDMDEVSYFDYTRAKCVDEETFLQEYMCVPSDDESAFIGYDLLDSCTMPASENWATELNPEATYYLGLDIGRTTDLTVLVLLEAVGEQMITRRLIEMKNTAFSEQERVVWTYAQLPHVRRVCVDASGIGRQFAERMRERFGGKVEEVVFTAGVKEDLAVTLRRAMEDRRVRIPHNDKLAADLRSIRKETTSSGNVRYVGERNTNGHADRFWALALAIHAGKNCTPTASPVVVPRRSRLSGAARRMAIAAAKSLNPFAD